MCKKQLTFYRLVFYLLKKAGGANRGAGDLIRKIGGGEKVYMSTQIKNRIFLLVLPFSDKCEKVLNFDFESTHSLSLVHLSAS